MSGSLAELIARRRRENPPDLVSKQFQIPVEVAALPPPPSCAPQPEHLRMEDAPRFSPQDPAAYKAFLEEHGFVVIEGVLGGPQVSKATDLCWQFLEDYGMSRHNPDTWSDDNFGKLGSKISGILSRGGFGQSDFQWYCRTQPDVVQVFSNIYETSDLLTSFDGGNIFRPWQAEGLQHQCTSSGWMHVDQGRTLRGMQCIQGLVTLTDVTEETGGFCCIPRSHHSHDDLMDAHASNDDNYLKVPSDFPRLQDPHPQVLPRARAGDLILWDSRTIHCSSPALTRPSCPPDQLLRMASYICMVPTDKASPEIIRKREEMFLCNVTSTHWPHILNFRRNPSDQQRNEVASLSAAALSLLVGQAAAAAHSQQEGDLV